MIFRLIKQLRTLAVLTFIFLPLVSFASDDAEVELNPRNPKPYTPVKATLVSYLFNVNTAMITWTVNGKVLLKGVGEKKLTIQTGGLGDRIPVHVSATTADAATTEIDFVITPESVDILYETPESYTPLFYEGRTLPGEGSIVKFVAMPSISENNAFIAPSALSFSWYVNNEYMDQYSGIGRQAALIPLDTLSTFTTIKVVVFGPHNTTAEKSIDIYPHDVLPLLYKYDEILGVDHTKVLGKRFESTKDFTLALEPFFLSSRGNQSGNDSYTWSLDGLPVTPLGGKLLSLRPKENSYGSRRLSIEMESSKRRLQKTSTEIGLIFDTRK